MADHVDVVTHIQMVRLCDADGFCDGPWTSADIEGAGSEGRRPPMSRKCGCLTGLWGQVWGDRPCDKCGGSR